HACAVACTASISYVCLSLTSFTTILRTLTNFFFFSSRRRHTRSKRDWSSDVCSSDLYLIRSFDFPSAQALVLPHVPQYVHLQYRSEERRVGKECRYRWSWCHRKIKKRDESNGAVSRTV